MVKNHKSANIFGIVLVLVMLFSVFSPLFVYAADTSTDPIATVAITDGLTSEVVQSAITVANSKLASGSNKDATNALYVKSNGSDVLVGGIEAGNFHLYKDGWTTIKDKERSKVMRTFVEELTRQGDADAVQNFMSSLQDQDSSVSSIMLPLIFESTKGDMYQAYKITSPFLEVLSVVLGVGAVVLILLLLFSTVMDLAYIGLPVWRESQAGKEGQGKNPFGVSYEAMTTVKEIEKGLGGGDGGYKNAYLLYFRRRALTYIILSICIMYLICGGLSGIIGFVLSLVSGITG